MPAALNRSETRSKVASPALVVFPTAGLPAHTLTGADECALEGFTIEKENASISCARIVALGRR